MPTAAVKISKGSNILAKKVGFKMAQQLN